MRMLAVVIMALASLVAVLYANQAGWSSDAIVGIGLFGLLLTGGVLLATIFLPKGR
jgi:hypothetical protein